MLQAEGEGPWRPGAPAAQPSKRCAVGRRAFRGLTLKDSAHYLPACLHRMVEVSVLHLSPVFFYQAVIFLLQKVVLPFPFSTFSSPLIPFSSPSHHSPPPAPNLDSHSLHWIPDATHSHLSSLSNLSNYSPVALTLHFSHLHTPHLTVLEIAFG